MYKWKYIPDYLVQKSSGLYIFAYIDHSYLVSESSISNKDGILQDQIIGRTYLPFGAAAHGQPWAPSESVAWHFSIYWTPTSPSHLVRQAAISFLAFLFSI